MPPGTPPHHREPVPFDPSEGYPAGADITYSCLGCGNDLPSMPERSVSCACGNVRIDLTGNRLEVEDAAKLRVYAMRP